jgi:hypothetical protein
MPPAVTVWALRAVPEAELYGTSSDASSVISPPQRTGVV